MTDIKNFSLFQLERVNINQLSLIKAALLLSFPSAIVCHYLLSLILWFRTFDLLLVAASLTLYFAGFAGGAYFANYSRSSLSRIAGILLSGHVLTSVIFAGFGSGYLALPISLLLGVTTGGLLALPLTKVMTPVRALLLSMTPLLGAYLLEAYGADSPLLLSAALALLASFMLFGSLKVIVPKPELGMNLKISLPRNIMAIAITTAIGGSLGIVLTPIIALLPFGISITLIGIVMSLSLIASQLIGSALTSQNVIQRTMVTTSGFSFFLALILLGIADSQLVFLILWFVVLVDFSLYNSFITAAISSAKHDVRAFNIITSIASILGPIIAVLLWATGSYQILFIMAALLILFSVLMTRRLLKSVK